MKISSDASVSYNQPTIGTASPNTDIDPQVVQALGQLLANMMKQLQLSNVAQTPLASSSGNGPVQDGSVQSAPAQANASAGGTTTSAVPSTNTASSDATTPANSDQSVIDGDATNAPSKTDQAPAGFDLKKIESLDGGLLGKTGNQQLKGAGTDGIQGSKGILDLVAKQAGGSGASDLDGPDTQAKDNEAWQMLEFEEQAKNAPQANGKQASAATRHNGNLSGLQGGSDEVASDSDIAFIQNAAKGDPTKGGASNKMNGSDGETSGLQQVGQKILDGFGSAAKWLGKIGAKVFPEFAPEIKGASAGIDIGLHAAGAAADDQNAGQAAANTAKSDLNPLNLLS